MRWVPCLGGGDCKERELYNQVPQLSWTDVTVKTEQDPKICLYRLFSEKNIT